MEKKLHPKSSKNRIWELDMLRGFAIIMVFFDHMFYDFGVLFKSWQTSSSDFLYTLSSIGEGYIFGDLRGFFRPAFLFLFFFTSGVCTAFSRNNFLRALKLAVVAMFISFLTFIVGEIFQPKFFILFGVLHCLALIIFIYAFIELLINLIYKLLNKYKKINKDGIIYRLIVSLVFLSLAAVFLIINEKYNVKLYAATTEFASIDTTSKIAGLFFYADNWWGSDYFPLFPFISFFFAGAGITPLIYHKKRTLFPCLDTFWHKPFSIPGKYSLVFYVGGQFVALLICLILSALFGVKL